jgi:hypothetical protein
MKKSVFFAVGLLAVAAVPTQAAPSPSSSPFAGLPDPPPPAECFEYIEPKMLPVAPMLLNRCTGYTWMLVRHPVGNAQDPATGPIVYRWAPILADKGEAVLGGVAGAAQATAQ